MPSGEGRERHDVEKRPSFKPWGQVLQTLQTEFQEPNMTHWRVN